MHTFRFVTVLGILTSLGGEPRAQTLRYEIDGAFAAPLEAVGDVDGDGYLDFSVTHFDSGSPGGAALEMRSGLDGSLLWGVGPDFFPYHRPIGDINGDGIEDFARFTALYGNSSVLEALSGIDGTLIQQSPAPGLREVRRAGDLDGDGVPDLLLMLDGAQRFVEVRSGADLHVQLVRMRWTPFLYGVEDTNGDGLGDLVTRAPGSDVYTIRSGLNGLVLQAQQSPLTELDICGDVDGDGTADYALWGPGPGITIYASQEGPASIGTAGLLTIAEPSGVLPGPERPGSRAFRVAPAARSRPSATSTATAATTWR